MHQFLRAIGFSDITKKQLNEVIKNIIDKPEKLKVTKDSEGNEFAELSCDVASNMGITVRGIYNDDDSFDIDYYYPYFMGSEKIVDIKERNSDLYEHTVMVTLLSVLVARKLKLDEKRKYNIAVGCLLHDIGLRFIVRLFQLCL